MRRKFAWLLMPLLLGACSESEGDSGPGGVSSEDAEALDEAAARLDQESAPAKLQRSQ
jgi:hypothetical protein